MLWKDFIRKYSFVYVAAVGIVISLAFGLSSAVTTAADAIVPDREVRFVIDAGHGGVDGGATSCTGVLESQINLEIALRLDDVMRLLGYKTVMIRTEDISIYTEGNTIAAKKVSDLKQRVKIANENTGAVLISIHQNTYPQERYSGAQIFYNSVEGSQVLAQRLQQAFAATINPGSSREIKKAENVYLMEHCQIPAVLVECGFISNVQEEANLRDPAYQKKLCCVLAATVISCTNGGAV